MDKKLSTKFQQFTSTKSNVPHERSKDEDGDAVVQTSMLRDSIKQLCDDYTASKHKIENALGGENMSTDISDAKASKPEGMWDIQASQRASSAVPKPFKDTESADGSDKDTDFDSDAATVGSSKSTFGRPRYESKGTIIKQEAAMQLQRKLVRKRQLWLGMNILAWTVIIGTCIGTENYSVYNANIISLSILCFLVVVGTSLRLFLGVIVSVE